MTTDVSRANLGHCDQNVIARLLHYEATAMVSPPDYVTAQTSRRTGRRCRRTKAAPPERRDGLGTGAGGAGGAQCESPPPAATASSSSGLSTTRVSVVSSRAAIEAALASAERVTLTGSMTPAPMRSPYSSVAAL